MYDVREIIGSRSTRLVETWGFSISIFPRNDDFLLALLPPSVSSLSPSPPVQQTLNRTASPFFLSSPSYPSLHPNSSYCSTMAPTASSASRKRKTVEVAPPAPAPQPVEALTGELVLESDEELLEDGMARDDEDEDGEEPFPELDLGSSDEEDELEGDGNAAEDDDVADDEDADDDDDDAALSDSDSEGYNSSDIDGLSDNSTQPTSYSSRRSRSKSPLSNFIAANTTKPDERDPSILLRPEDPLAGKMVVSELTGRPKRVYPDIEAGYGSESSTEDVSPVAKLGSRTGDSLVGARLP